MADLAAAPDPADGLPALVVGGSRADQKHFYLGYYAAQMSKLRSFPRRAYTELFAGPGRVQYEETGAFEDGSPLLALRHQFTEFVFVEKRPDFADALRARCSERQSVRPIRVIEGDCNGAIDEVIRLLPPHGLTLAFIDPPPGRSRSTRCASSPA
jgi:three-Cys-motif partner protein